MWEVQVSLLRRTHFLLGTRGAARDSRDHGVDDSEENMIVNSCRVNGDVNVSSPSGAVKRTIGPMSC